MECKICGREKRVHEDFKHNRRARICDTCMDTLGYNPQYLHDKVEHFVSVSVSNQMPRHIQRALPDALKQLIEDGTLAVNITAPKVTING